MTMGKEELMDQAQRNGFEVGAIYSAEDLLRDPQLVARRFFVDVEHADLDPESDLYRQPVPAQ